MKTAHLIALVLIALASSQTRAATFTVTSLFDVGPGTLRACIDQANNNPGADTIVFHPALTGTLRPLSTIFVLDSVTLIGPESRTLSIDGSAADIVLQLETMQNQELGLIDLEFRDGLSAVSIHSVNAKLNVHRCVFRNFGLDGPIEAGVFNPNWASAQTITGMVRSCSFINNRGLHAGVVITKTKPSGESLEFTNCTFCNNSSSIGASVAWIWNVEAAGQGTINFTNCTMTGNSGGDAGVASGAIENTGTKLACRVKNSVMQENTAGAGADPNFSGLGAMLGRSLEGTNIFSGAMLTPLQMIDRLYVRTPLPGSLCIDASIADPAVVSDQLGRVRPYMVPDATPAPGSDGSDVGAVERQSGGCGLADINSNGRVDGADLSVLLATFGSTCP